MFSKMKKTMKSLAISPKMVLTVVVAGVALWIVFKKMQRKRMMMLPEPDDRWMSEAGSIDTSDNGYIPGSGFQDAGYGSGIGSIGPHQEGFEAGFDDETAGCPEHDLFKQYPSMPFVQAACKKEPDWNLPYEARLKHRPMYEFPEGRTICQKRHPMDSVYAPPNEGFDLDY